MDNIESVEDDPSSSSDPSGSSGSSGSPRPFTIRSDRLPPGWPKYLATGSPVRPSPGPAARLMRSIVSQTYLPSVYRDRVDWKILSDDERYACASTVWRRTIYRMQYDPQMYAPSARAERLVRRMYGCTVAGYKVDRPGIFPSCNVPICPYCYARRVAQMFNDLYLAFQSRPPGSKVYVSAVYLTEERPKFRRLLNKRQLACACIFYHPRAVVHPPTEPGEPDPPLTLSSEWLVNGVMMTNVRSDVSGRKYQRTIRNRNDIVAALTAWMRYPRPWYFGSPVIAASTAVRLLSMVPANVKLYSQFGVGRSDCIPAKSWFGWR